MKQLHCRTCFAFLLVFCLQCSAADLSLQPASSLSPTEVVNFQLQALQANSNGDGIAATYRFASPSNKATTGPLQRFSTLFDIEQYQPLLNHRSARVQLLSNNGQQAELVTSIVDNDGTLHWYRFRLSRQQANPFINCWMTDAVMLEKPPEKSA